MSPSVGSDTEMVGMHASYHSRAGPKRGRGETAMLGGGWDEGGPYLNAVVVKNGGDLQQLMLDRREPEIEE